MPNNDGTGRPIRRGTLATPNPKTGTYRKASPSPTGKPIKKGTLTQPKSFRAGEREMLPSKTARTFENLRVRRIGSAFTDFYKRGTETRIPRGEAIPSRPVKIPKEMLSQEQIKNLKPFKTPPMGGGKIKPSGGSGGGRGGSRSEFRTGGGGGGEGGILKRKVR